MEHYIIDTNFFFNLEIHTGLGRNPKEIVITLTALAKKLKALGKAEFYMPPRIRDEFLTFIEAPEVWVQDFFSILTIKSPNIDAMNFPAQIFYKLVEDIRERSYRGMKVAEEMIDQGAQKMIGRAEISKIEYQKELGQTITRLRDRYRQATRVGFLDSVADLDLIVLAHELNGFLISSDEGVIQWGRRFGVKEIVPHEAKHRFEALLE